MTIKRLTPTVRALGYLRLWRDDIAEIVGYVKQLPDAEIDMEADNNQLDDVQADLPKIGRRLSYFTLIARRPDETGQQRQVLKIHFGKEGCYVEADNPDVAIRGIISDIEQAVRKYRRLPMSIPHLAATQVASPVLRPAPAVPGLLYAVSLLGSPVLLIVSVISISNSLAHDAKGVIFPLPWAVFAGAIGAILLVAVVTAEARSRTVLRTATRTEAPTWWQEYRGHIAIAVIFGVIFFFLGALVHF